MISATPTKVSISDSELQRRTLCSLYTPTVVNPLESPAERTFRWAVKRRYEGYIESHQTLREKFMEEWNQEPREGSEQWVGPNRCAGFARRVCMFLLKYRVIQPFRPYTLQLEAGEVTGENALAAWDKYRSEPVPMVIDFPISRPRNTLIPNNRVLAQWLAARQDVDDIDLGIVHLPLISGDGWTTKNVAEPLARKWINSIVSQAAKGADFPRAGTQCGTCSRPCDEIFREPQGFAWA